MEQAKILRINELAKKSKTVGLTPAETAERQILRKEYIESFKGNLKATLDSVVIVDKDGNRRNIKDTKEKQ
jgi:uncharacterized protein YnzC (UPF0291/DUF896 family)